jgi:hypothetical protein
MLVGTIGVNLEHADHDPAAKIYCVVTTNSGLLCTRCVERYRDGGAHRPQGLLVLVKTREYRPSGFCHSEEDQTFARLLPEMNGGS